MTSGIYTPADKDVTARATGATPIGSADVVEIAIVHDARGIVCVYLGDYRICGRKPVPGSRWTTFKVGVTDINHAISLQREALAETPSSAEGVDNKDSAP